MESLRDYSERIAEEIQNAYDRNESDPDNEQPDLTDWVINQLDIEVRVGLDKKYRSCEISRTLGGPSCYVDTGAKQVITYSGTEQPGIYYLDSDVCDAIDEIVEEIYKSQ